MLRYIREQWGITREDLAFYLGLSPDMVKSIEGERRNIPKYCDKAVAAAVDAIRKCNASGKVVISTPASSQQIRLLKRRHRTYTLRLSKCTNRLEKMQSAYALACTTLGMYEALVQSHTPSRTDADRLRLKWAQRKLNETTYSLQENNETAQEIVALEIAGLKSMLQALEASGLFPFKTTK
jgi:hypothetical protein